MQKITQKSKSFLILVFLALLTAALFLPNIFATEEGELTARSEKKEVVVEKDTQKKNGEKLPENFVPNEKVSADQAVAFPTDI